MQGDFLQDENSAMSYCELLEFLRQKKTLKYVLCESDFVQFFAKFVASLAASKDVMLLDSNLAELEISNLEFDKNLLGKESEISEPCDFKNLNELFEKVKNSTSKISLFTSGSTGRPKLVSHTVKSLTRFLKISPSHKNDVWAFAYLPSHIAGIQVFLQAFLNGNKIVNVFEKTPAELSKIIEIFAINRISASPTFYRLIPDSSKFESVKSCSLGGEKSGENLVNRLKNIFPNARIYNVYAATEFASVLKSTNGIFEIPSEMSELLKIENNELLVHSSLLGDSKNFAKLNADGFFASGDFVEFVDDEKSKFRFAGRASNFVNVAGYKVNLEEVEEAIREIPEIKNARCYAQKNSVIGNLICADVVMGEGKNLRVDEIRKELSKKLQNFKIPRKFNFVENLESTNRGKIKRL